MIRSRRILSLLLILSVLLFSLLSCFGSSNKWTKGKSGNTILEIGLYAPLTGIHDNYGIAVRNGAELAVNEINKAGGVNGFGFYLDVKDSASFSNNAESAFEELTDNGMKISLGGVISEEVEVFSEFLRESKIPMIICGTASDSVLNESHCFSMSPLNKTQGERIAESIKNNGISDKIALFYNSDSIISREITEAFERKAGELGIHISERQTYTNHSNTDFSDQIRALSECDADWVFLPVSAYDAAVITEQANGSGLRFISAEAVDGIIYETKNRIWLEDMIFGSTFYIGEETSPDSAEKKFSDAYKSFYGEIPTQQAANAYDAVYAIAEAIKKSELTGETVSSISIEVFREKITDALLSVGFDGASGFSQWNSSRYSSRNTELFCIESGKIKKYTHKTD